MATPGRDVLGEVRLKGFACSNGPYTEAQFLDLGREMGDIVENTTVRVVPGKQTYLAGTDPIPLHTDHPVADFVLWRCEAQDPIDGASVLIDGRAALSSLAADVARRLQSILLPAAVHRGAPATPTPIASPGTQPRLFFAPWLEPTERHPWMLEALASFRAALSRASARSQVRLRPGQVLAVDNGRMLHGRAGLRSGSPRRLRRLWVSRRGLVHLEHMILNPAAESGPQTFE